MLPRIEFRRSWIYDQMLIPLRRGKHKEQPVTHAQFNRQIKKLDAYWNSGEGKKILREMSQILKLPWREKTIVCYVTWGVIPFSDPVTINYFKDFTTSIDVLTHELIHRLWSEEENWTLIEPAWKRLQKQQKNIDNTTRSHFPLHAVHQHLLLKFFGEKRLNREKQAVQKPHYLKSWEIVGELGYKNIINTLIAGRK